MNRGRLLATGTGAALIAVGVGAVVDPKASAAMFGVPVDGDALVFVRAAGARDAILGAIVVTSGDEGGTLRRVLGLTSLIGLSDGIALAALRGPRWQHALHLGGFAALGLLALRLDE
ncbi:MAG TPA: DUF4267 domain-containing protein [Candidatus Elarobacter sp.]|nr:DUF4267 domain-containing protein [Candidatus Elarobacter sp.]